MSVAQLREAGAEYQSLREARDLEDCLFGEENALALSTDDRDEDPSPSASGAVDDRPDSPDSLDDDGKFESDSDGVGDEK